MGLQKDRGRAQRRRQDSARMKARSRRIYPHDPKARLADHLAACSCYSCGNPRYHFNELTMQERRADIQARQSCEDEVVRE